MPHYKEVMPLETCKVAHKNKRGYLIINACDFDEKHHKLYVDLDDRKQKDLDDKKQKDLDDKKQKDLDDKKKSRRRPAGN